MRYLRTAILLNSAGLVLFGGSVSALEFRFNPEAGMQQEAIDGFETAGELWAQIYTDDVVVNIDIAFRSLSFGVLGQTRSERVRVSYQEVLDALDGDRTSGADADSVGSLQDAPSFDLLLNRTRNSPHGSGSATPFLDDDGDDNNTTIRITRANAKALGLIQADDSGLDASITFSSDFNWDFDPDDGILPNHFNFVYVAAHEIGHMLGFTSGVDILDINSPPAGGPFRDDIFTFVSPADIFRFSAGSIGHGDGVIDWTVDTRDKYFSIDGGTTDLGGFSTGRNLGDGQQASHWKDDLGLGIMDPTVAAGEVSTISTLDTQLFDVVGYDLESIAPAAEADLSISGSTTVDVTFTITATNDGPADVTGAIVTNSFPVELSMVSWQCAGTGGATCTASGTEDIQDVVNLPVGGVVTYTASGTAGSIGQHSASITAPSGISDSDLSNNSTGGDG